MDKRKAIFHKFKSIVGYSVATIVIVIALGVSGLRFILTSANLYQKEVEELASSLLEQPVKIGSMDAKLSGLVPTLIFHDVELLSTNINKPLLILTRIDVGLSIDALIFQQDIIPTDLTIRGLDLTVIKKVDGSLKIDGVDIKGLMSSKKQNNPTSAIDKLLMYKSEVAIEDSNVTWKDEQNAGLTWNFDNVNLLLKNTQNRHQLTLLSNLPKSLGESIKASFDFEGDVNNKLTWEVKSYIEAEKVNLAPVQRYIKNSKFKVDSGVIDLELWGNWGNNQLKSSSGKLSVYNLLYQNEKNKKSKLQFASGIFNAVNNEQGLWQVAIDKFNYSSGGKYWPETRFSLAFNNTSNKKFHLYAQHLQPQELTAIINEHHLLGDKDKKLINDININGDIFNFNVGWENNNLVYLMADFNALNIDAWENIPEVKNFSGKLNYQKGYGQLSFTSDDMKLGFPDLFRKTFNISDAKSDIQFWNFKKGIFIETDNLAAENADVTSLSKMKLWLPKNNASPIIDLNVAISKSNAKNLSAYLPVTIMNDQLVKWIDNGILNGKSQETTILMQGKLDEFPYDKKEGMFAVDVVANNVDIHYQNGWPKVSNANVNAYFTGQGMQFDLSNGSILNSKLFDSQAIIKSFRKPVLEVVINSSGTSHDALQFLVNSPVMSGAKDTVNSMKVSGEVKTTANITIPLNKPNSPNRFQGTTTISNTDVSMMKDKITLANINGNVLFSDKGLSSQNITGNVFDQPTIFSIDSLKKKKGINISLSGMMEPGFVLSKFNIPGADKVTGLGAYKGDIFFPNASSKIKHPVLTVKSDLYGVKSQLPEAFYKKIKTRQEFTFKTIFTGRSKTQYFVSFGNKLSTIFEVDQSSENAFLSRGAISFSKTKAILPKKYILYIDGSVERVTPSKWLKALGLGKSNKPPTFIVNPIIVNFDELNIWVDKNNKNNSKVANPSLYPAIEGVVRKLTFDKTFLGRLDFKTSVNKKGVRLDEMILSAKNMKLFANGEWSYKNKQHATELDMTLSSNDFGSMLTDLGFAAIIEKGVAKTIGKFNWLGAPTQFSLDKLNGEIQLEIKDGNVKDVDAGAGRLLGFFSLSALPRKLFGDFKGEFKSGFSFDKSQGEILIRDGDAYTDDFAITSTIAEVTVSGRTGLAARDYENIIQVIPEVGGGLAGVTALLVNLPAGIGMWLLDKITGEQFNDASTQTYEVSGSWDAPVIESVQAIKEE